MKKYTTALATGLAGVLTVVTGCGSGDVTTGAASGNSNSTFSMFFNLGDGHGFDPDVSSWEAYLDDEGIFEGLVIPGSNAATKPIPGIAVSWKVSANGRVYTFNLRKNEKFSNGDPVTAQDFVYSMQRAVNPNTSVAAGESPISANNLPIVNAQQILQGISGYTPSDLGVKALNNYTLQITLTRNDPTFLRDLTLPTSSWVVPLDPKVVNAMNPSDWSNPAKIVSDGPYMLSSYSLKTSATLVPNPHYYGKSSLKKITVYYNSTTGNDTSLASFKSGQMQESMLQPQDLAAAKADSTLKKDLHMFPASAQYTLAVLPSKNTALQNAKVREAFALAIDRTAICNSVLQGAGQPAYNYYLPTWLNPWVEKYAQSYNPAQAKKLLAQAGYPNGKGFPTVDIIVGSTTDPVASAIQQMWQQNLGVKVNFEGLEWGQYVNALKTQLPSDQVGFVNESTNANYANLALPQTLESWIFPGNTALINGFLSPDNYQAWYKIDSNSQLSPAQKQAEEFVIYQKGLPASILNNVELGIRAFQSGNQSLLQQYYGQQVQQNFFISIYTPLQPVLLSSQVKGYQPDQMLLIDPPYWLNNITV
ncbi:peptide ABC transporter substrate-binding protein [Alicyclobacillus fastidiosus]|uniref:Peptide ABC transporter substrate-binding protein n=1 Tax=Alicyclobacillus fastidiosus TaxID=392011 RepID=A0ABY6ZF91_9BACL|nr:peptide ABC transporter substrate-binding protein [Alicyclobacillus fastidiosus]WAH41514.1 peptide ABC transporter substrate-binding protein [Alicyclobacillus fastidiosus]